MHAGPQAGILQPQFKAIQAQRKQFRMLWYKTWIQLRKIEALLITGTGVLTGVKYRTFARTALMKSWAPGGTARLRLELGRGEPSSKMGSFETMLKRVASRDLPPNGVNPVSSS